jgi:glutathione synthase/RimK-type ligase-like ATP-grasp enzyme
VKHILIIGSRKSGKKNNPEAIARRIASEATRVTLAYWEDLVLDIATGRVRVSAEGKQLLEESIDLCITIGWYKNGKQAYYRDVAFALALILKAKGVRLWNSEILEQRSVTKLSTMVQLALENIPVPRSIFSITTRNAISHLSYPYIAKAIAASRGDHNYLVSDAGDRDKVLEQDFPFLIQPFLENDHDLRVICFGGKPSLVLRRSRAAESETHLNNTSQGGQARWIPLDEMPPELLTFCEKISKIMSREMAGIDLIPDASSLYGYSCLEVNAVPQLTSGTDVDIKLDAFARAINEL